jgi:hypothetical protein
MRTIAGHIPFSGQHWSLQFHALCDRVIRVCRCVWGGLFRPSWIRRIRGVKWRICRGGRWVNWGVCRRGSRVNRGICRRARGVKWGIGWRSVRWVGGPSSRKRNAILCQLECPSPCTHGDCTIEGENDFDGWCIGAFGVGAGAGIAGIESVHHLSALQVLTSRRLSPGYVKERLYQGAFP